MSHSQRPLRGCYLIMVGGTPSLIHRLLIFRATLASHVGLGKASELLCPTYRLNVSDWVAFK